ncbi:Fic family protein [Actinophytocola oryzae]|uniref:Fic family protein n=2 Tax=Actinophytocola oryzae TaxID=502181 RepID=A0A4R7UV24_9PSEU|nr:Fic family protein [Actinophytocola oryzae]
MPDPLPTRSPELNGATYRAVADARAALAALDSTARRLPNPRLFRTPSLRTEAQSTSALEGTYAPLAEVLTADEERPQSTDMREILNYVIMAENAFNWIESGRPLTVSLLEELQGALVRGTKHEGPSSGKIRDHQVAVGRREGARPGDLSVQAARFVPPPPGLELQASLRDLLDWMADKSIGREIDPVVSAALSHYQFETLHPFHDGNGRIGRMLIVASLYEQGVLLEPTLTVSPWFEARRTEYYDYLFAVSATADWNTYVQFFAHGLEASAQRTHDRMITLVDIRAEMKENVRESSLRADTAHALIDFAISNISFTVRAVEKELQISYGRANGLVGQLVQLGVLAPLYPGSGGARRFYAPQAYNVLLDET